MNFGDQEGRVLALVFGFGVIGGMGIMACLVLFLSRQ